VTVGARADTDETAEAIAECRRRAEPGVGGDALAYVAYRGLESYRFIGVAWLMHSGWDVAHHLWGHPIMFFAPTSSFQCGVCDAVLAIWFFVLAERR
jgi:hypothetical protein